MFIDRSLIQFISEAGDDKNAHLWKLENAAEKLKLFKADLLDFDSILAAVKGCDGLFHLATPVFNSSVPNPEVQTQSPFTSLSNYVELRAMLHFISQLLRV